MCISLLIAMVMCFSWWSFGWHLTLQLWALCRAGDTGFRQLYTPGRDVRTADLPPSYFLVAHCLRALSRDLQARWHVTAPWEF